MTTLAGMPDARHMAAVKTACSVQSPDRLRATSLAAANPTVKFLSLMFLWTQCAILERFFPGVDDALGRLFGQPLHPQVAGRDQRIGARELRVDVRGTRRAVERAQALHFEDRRFRAAVIADCLPRIAGYDLGRIAVLERDPVPGLPGLFGIGDLVRDLDRRTDRQVELDRPARRHGGFLGRAVLNVAPQKVLLLLEHLTLGIDPQRDVELGLGLAVDLGSLLDFQERPRRSISHDHRLDRVRTGSAMSQILLSVGMNILRSRASPSFMGERAMLCSAA